MNLLDAFPSEFRDNHFASKISVGSVHYCEIELSSVTKHKFLIIVSTFSKDTCAVVIINSEINFNMNKTQQLRNEHIPCTTEDCPFLDYDSFIDCTELFEIGTEVLLANMQDDSGSHKGELKRSLMETVQHKLASSIVIEPKKLKKHGFM